ncbi:MAG: hypothetical protein PVI55_06705 [Desulfobacterales bacterium]
MMKNGKSGTYFTIGVFVLLFVSGCCAKINQLPAAAGTPEIEKNNVVFKGGKSQTGATQMISVEVYCPTEDGTNDIKISWAGTSSGSGEFASINFPEEHFGDGPSRVEIKACHHNSMRVEAFDKNNNMIDDAAIASNERNVSKTLILEGGKIRRIDVIGSEIGINDVCWQR